MIMTQVAQNTGNTILKVPLNTPAAYNGISWRNVSYLTPTREQIESVQTLLNKVTIRLAKFQETQENQTGIMEGNGKDSTL